MFVIVICGCFYFPYQQLYDNLSAYSILSTNTVQRRNAVGNLALPKDLCLEMLSSVTDNIWEYERNMELWASSVIRNFTVIRNFSALRDATHFGSNTAL